MVTGPIVALDHDEAATSSLTKYAFSWKFAFKMRLDGGRRAPAKLLAPKTRLEGPAPP